MTIKELKDMLSRYDENLEVLIDDSVDGGFEDIRKMKESDIVNVYGKIIFNYKT